jgi:hypothetical protein
MPRSCVFLRILTRVHSTYPSLSSVQFSVDSPARSSMTPSFLLAPRASSTNREYSCCRDKSTGSRVCIQRQKSALEPHACTSRSKRAHYPPWHGRRITYISPSNTSQLHDGLSRLTCICTTNKIVSFKDVSYYLSVGPGLFRERMPLVN